MVKVCGFVSSTIRVLRTTERRDVFGGTIIIIGGTVYGCFMSAYDVLRTVIDFSLNMDMFK